MKYLLDTCVISELIKAQSNPKVIEWISNQNEEDLYLSVLTLGEIQKGITKLPDSEKKLKLQNWLDIDLSERFNNKILDIDNQVALHWGKMQGKSEKKGENLSVIDSLLAATSIVYDLIFATRNIKDIMNCGCKFINPWEE